MSLNRRTSLLSWVLFIGISATWGVRTEGQAQQYVYFVKTDSCAHAPARRIQTGFKIANIRGIVTALHGVADCRSLIAQNDAGQILGTSLKIVQADIAHDVALLAPADAAGWDLSGFVVADVAPLLESTTLQALGHPLGLKTRPTNLIFHLPISSFDDLIPRTVDFALVRQGLSARKSPSLDIRMIDLQGALLPGHSGSPITIPGSDRVVAVANGGLKGGTLSKSWAVIWSDVQLVAPNPAELLRLQAANPFVLFSVDEGSLPAGFPLTVSVREDSAFGPGRVVESIVTLESDGTISGITTLTTGGLPFCAQTLIAIVDQLERLVAQTSAPNPSCVASRGASPQSLRWKASVPEKAILRAASISIVQNPTSGASKTKGIDTITNSATLTELPYAADRARASAHDQLGNSHHVRTQAVLTDDGILRIASRFENDNVVRGYTAHVEIVLLDSAGVAIDTVKFPAVSRASKAPGRAMCTDEFRTKRISSAATAKVASLRVITKRDGTYFVFPGSGYVCNDVPFRGLGILAAQMP